MHKNTTHAAVSVLARAGVCGARPARRHNETPANASSANAKHSRNQAHV